MVDKGLIGYKRTKKAFLQTLFPKDGKLAEEEFFQLVLKGNLQERFISGFLVKTKGPEITYGASGKEISGIARKVFHILKGDSCSIPESTQFNAIIQSAPSGKIDMVFMTDL